MSIPHDYEERVYAGVLGKIIGVYLGRPIENWSHERIAREIGEVSYYVHERQQGELVVPDDDITGTFAFLRALPEHGNRRDITPVQIGQTWLNHIIENRTILWWGGLGNSTEHTAYLRLAGGIPAPASGSAALNSKVVAEQIGAQIFIDGWAMVAPGDPELAADLARRAASVSHDGEAVYAAQVIAAMEALAFEEADIGRLLDAGVSLIPRDSVIYRLIADLREWHAGEPDWRRTRERLEANYGYDRYGGNCHVVPNHGLIVHGLLHGEGDLGRSLMIVNSCGWDTDCNSGNLGCLLGIRGGLAALEGGPDWRGPVADRLFLPGPDGGRAITDALTEAYHVVNVGRALAGQPPVAPKGGARYHFEQPGAVQGFRPENSPEVRGVLDIDNVSGHSRSGSRSLALVYRHLAPGRFARAAVQTFLPPEVPLTVTPRTANPWKYTLLASPSLYPGQTVEAALEADAGNAQPVRCRLYIRAYDGRDELERAYGPEVTLEPGRRETLEWRLGGTGQEPIAEVGIELSSGSRADGSVYLDHLTWRGEPYLTLTRPADDGLMWRRAWVDAVDRSERRFPEPFRLVQNRGTGMLTQGSQDWRDYTVEADVSPHLVAAAGIGARVQGLRRYYALLLVRPGIVQLVKGMDGEAVLAEAPLAWDLGGTYLLRLEARGNRLRAWVDGQPTFDLPDETEPLLTGGVALICREGRTSTNVVTVRPAPA